MAFTSVAEFVEHFLFGRFVGSGCDLDRDVEVGRKSRGRII